MTEYNTPATRVGLSIGDVVIVGEGYSCPHNFTVGKEAVFTRDDGTKAPLFIQGGRTQYLNLNEITIKARKTPAQMLGLKEGDEVVIKPGTEWDRYFKGPVYLACDDNSEIPKFRDKCGRTLWVPLNEVTKAPEGPVAGVSWASAPEGATHYSLDNDFIERWHKQNDDGSFAFKSIRGFHTYAEPLQFGINVDKMIPVPGVVTKPNLVALMPELKEAKAALKDAQDTLAIKEAAVNAKLKTISDAGFCVMDDRLTKDVPVSEWCEGDIVVCVTRTGAGLADLTVGKEYTIIRGYDDRLAVRDDYHDRMANCVANGCFKFVRRAK